MSTLKVDAIRHNSATSDAITTVSDGTCTAKLTSIGGGGLSHRNIIINGAMKVSQRHGTSATTTSNAYVLDRFSFYHNVTNAVTSISQSTDNPGNGFTHSMRVDVTTAGTPGATQHANINYNIEGQDLGHIDNGAATAKKLTLSFWVKSPKAGNHAVGLYKAGNTTRQTTKTYSVSSANTWEKKNITYDGDTAGGGLLITNGFGIGVNFFLAAGSSMTGTDSTSWVNYSNAAYANGHAVNCLDNAANDFYLTGVQLEVGDTATSFEHRSFGEELSRCCRYFYRYKMDYGYGQYFSWISYGNTDQRSQNIFFPTTMRTSPSMTYESTMGNYQNLGLGGTISAFIMADSGSNEDSTAIRVTTQNSITSGSGGMVRGAGTTNGYFDFSAEL